MWDAISDQIQAATGQPFHVQDVHSVGGGSINRAVCISNGQQRYFTKLNQASQVSMFEAEALGLKDLAASNAICIPQSICWGTVENNSFHVLEWLDLGRNSGTGWREMGRRLAQLHRSTGADRFGWHRNNTIGSTLQPNPWTQDWSTFFTEHRIGFQLQLAQRRGAHFAQAEPLLKALPQLLNHDPVPSLVHGDLWSGNAGFTRSGEPVLFDPAVYWGDREVDLAMTELFGGFPAAFYDGYQNEWPLDAGYAQRKTVYNLYHILNHFNLFGGSYRYQAEQIIAQAIASV